MTAENVSEGQGKTEVRSQELGAQKDPGLSARPSFRGFRRSESIAKLTGALAAATLEFGPVVKTRQNPYYNSKYADLAELMEATVKPLAKQGLVIVQFIDSSSSQQVEVTTLLSHISDEWIETTMRVPGAGKAKEGVMKFDVQTIGSASTYARRYAYQALLNLAAEADDDGNAVVEGRASAPRTAPARTTSPAPRTTAPVNQRPAAPTNAARPGEKDSGVRSQDSGVRSQDSGAGSKKPEAGSEKEGNSAPRTTNSEPATSGDRLPTDEEYAAITSKLGAYKVQRSALKAWILKFVGKEEPRAITVNEWKAVEYKLEEAAKKNGLAEELSTAK